VLHAEEDGQENEDRRCHQHCDVRRSWSWSRSGGLLLRGFVHPGFEPVCVVVEPVLQSNSIGRSELNIYQDRVERGLTRWRRRRQQRHPVDRAVQSSGRSARSVGVIHRRALPPRQRADQMRPRGVRGASRRRFSRNATLPAPPTACRARTPR
jgi:hypothetical protein